MTTLVVTNPGSQTVGEGQFVNLAIQATGIGTLHYAAVNLPTGLGIDATTGVITGVVDYAAAEDFGGVYATTVIVADQWGNATTQFAWTVTDTLRAPALANPGDQASNTGEPVSLQLSGSSPDGDSLAYSAVGLPTGLAVDGGGAITGTIAHSANLSNSVTVTATDTVSGLTASQTFGWAVTPTSHAPTLDPIADQTNSAGDVVDVSVNGNSADGSTLTYSITGQPGGVGIDPLTGEITGTIANTAYGAIPYQVTVTVSDGTSSASQTFAWKVGAVLLTNPGDRTNTFGDAVSLPVVAQDFSGGTLTYSAVGLPNGLAINQLTGVIGGTVTPGAAWQGDFTVTVTVTNGTEVASRTFDWAVTAASNATAPTITDPGPQTNTSGDAVSLQIQASSPNGALLYSVTGLPYSLTSDPVTGKITGTLASFDVGTRSVTVTVTDPLGGTASDTFSWTVSAAPVTLTVRSLTAVAGKQLGPVQVATFTSADLTAGEGDYIATIAWGDGAVTTGTVSGGNGSFSVQGVKTYAVPAVPTPSYPLSVTISDKAAHPLATGSGEVTMMQESNALQVANLFADDNNVVAYTQVATFEVSDLGATLGSYTAKIDWGEGTPTAGYITPGVGQGVFQIWGNHPYQTPGNHTFGVYVFQAGGAMGLLMFHHGEEKEKAPAAKAMTVVATNLRSAGDLAVAGKDFKTQNDLYKSLASDVQNLFNAKTGPHVKARIFSPAAKSAGVLMTDSGAFKSLTGDEVPAGTFRALNTLVFFEWNVANFDAQTKFTLVESIRREEDGVVTLDTTKNPKTITKTIAEGGTFWKNAALAAPKNGATTRVLYADCPGFIYLAKKFSTANPKKTVTYEVNETVSFDGVANSKINMVYVITVKNGVATFTIGGKEVK